MKFIYYNKQCALIGEEVSLTITVETTYLKLAEVAPRVEDNDGVCFRESGS